MSKILLVEDDLDVCHSISERLKSEGHTIEIVNDGKEGSDRLRLYNYDAIILDWNLPKKNGPEICREFRQRGGTTPVIMLTGQTDIEQRVIGLDAGAEDYLTKPFSVRELAARIRAMLRRPAIEQDHILTEQGVTLNTSKHTAMLNDRQLHLQPKEFQILELLLSRRNYVFSPDSLLEIIWKGDSEANVDSVRTAIKRLRQKLEGEGNIVKTVHGKGYMIGD